MVGLAITEVSKHGNPLIPESCLLVYTVVKWGHTEGIPREKTSSEKYTVFSL